METGEEGSSATTTSCCREETQREVGFVVALYNYAARKPTELSFRKGDVLALLRPPEADGWWYGRHAILHARRAGRAEGEEEEEGLFAHNYVRRLRAEVHVARFAFRGKGADESYLPFDQGDRLEVLLKDPNGWWLARAAGEAARLGLVPANYITPAASRDDSTRRHKHKEEEEEEEADADAVIREKDEEAAPQSREEKEEEEAEEEGEMTTKTTAMSSSRQQQQHEGDPTAALTTVGKTPSAQLDEALALLDGLWARYGHFCRSTEWAVRDTQEESGPGRPAASEAGHDGFPPPVDRQEETFRDFLRRHLRRRDEFAAVLSDLQRQLVPETPAADDALTEVAMTS